MPVIMSLLLLTVCVPCTRPPDTLMEMKFCFQWESLEISPYIRGTHLNFVSQTHIIQNPAISAFYASSELDFFLLRSLVGITLILFTISCFTWYIFNYIHIYWYIGLRLYQQEKKKMACEDIRKRQPKEIMSFGTIYLVGLYRMKSYKHLKDTTNKISIKICMVLE